MIKLDSLFKGVKSGVKRFTDWTLGKLQKRLDRAAGELEEKLRQKFSVSARNALSLPGEYPRALNGYISKGIKVEARKLTWRPIQNGLRASVTGRGADKIARLKEGYVIKPKNRKYLTIPVSLKARRHSSHGHGARSLGVDLQVKTVVIKGRRVRALVKKRSSVSRRITGLDHTVHYILSSRAHTISPRKGLADAVNEEMNWIQQFILRPLSDA